MKKEKTITLIPSKVNGVVNAPPSKAITLRALFIASVADGETIIKNALLGEDQLLAINALKKMNVKIVLNKKQKKIIVHGALNKLVNPKKQFVGNSGVTMRFLIPLASFAEKNTIITGVSALQKRPVKELVKAIKKLGGVVQYVEKNYSLPVKVFGKTLKGGSTIVDCSKSSQFLSALLVSSSLMKNGLRVKAVKLSSKPFIDLTIKTMRFFGVSVKKNNNEFVVEKNVFFKPKTIVVEGDYTNASYFLASAAISNGWVKVKNLVKNSIQGDEKIIEILEKMGAKIGKGKNFVTCKGEKLVGVTVDLNNYPDLVPTIAVLGACAKGKTIIKNIEHLKFKETNRIKAIITELRKTGVMVKENKKVKGIEIIGGTPKQAIIETYNDHRIAMSFALLGLKTRIVIKNPSCVKKSFPSFFKEFQKILKPKKKTNIVLIGMRGAGKTFIGKKISEKIGFEFIDTDELFEKKFGSIKKIFKEKGESFFREKEKKIIKKIIQEKNKIISCGGGVVLDSENIKFLKKNGVIVYLTAPLKILARRISKTEHKRPSLTDEKIDKELKIVFKKRKKLYLKAKDKTINTNKPVEECVDEIINFFLKTS